MTLAAVNGPRTSFAFARTPTFTQHRAMSVFNASRLVGKTVLVTGASAGIGAVSVAGVCRVYEG